MKGTANRWVSEGKIHYNGTHTVFLPALDDFRCLRIGQPRHPHVKERPRRMSDLRSCQVLSLSALSNRFMVSVTHIVLRRLSGPARARPVPTPESPASGDAGHHGLREICLWVSMLR